MSVPTVAVFATEQFSPFHLSLPGLVFNNASQEQALFDLKFCAEKPGLLRAANGFSLEAAHGLETVGQADIVVVPFWPAPDKRPSPELVQALRTARGRGAKLVGFCRGAYVLAYSGLLDGLSAATHWKYEEDFKSRFPKIHLNTNVLYVDEGGLITSAGTAAGLDCCLYVVREKYGSAVANTIARHMVVSPHREGGQAQFIDRPVPDTSDDARIGRLLEDLRKNLHQPHDLDSLASAVRMSRRTFTRHFQKATGMSVVEWLTAARLHRSQELLELTNHSVDDIAFKAGFMSPVSFRKYFKDKFGVSPSTWRKTFQGNMWDGHLH